MSSPYIRPLLKLEFSGIRKQLHGISKTILLETLLLDFSFETVFGGQVRYKMLLDSEQSIYLKILFYTFNIE